MSWKTLSINCNVSNRGAGLINFNEQFVGATSKGIKIGSTEEELLKAYGNPERITYAAAPRGPRQGESIKPDVYMQWPKLGISVVLNPETGVKRIDIYPPMVAK